MQWLPCLLTPRLNCALCDAWERRWFHSDGVGKDSDCSLFRAAFNAILLAECREDFSVVVCNISVIQRLLAEDSMHRSIAILCSLILGCTEETWP